MQESRDIQQLREGFDDFYEAKLKPLFDGIETIRLKHLKSYKIRLYAAFIIAVVGAIFYGKTFFEFLKTLNSDQAEGVLQLAAAVVVGACAFIAAPIVSFKKKTKTDIFPTFVSYFEGFKHFYEEHIPQEILDKSLAVPPISKVSGDDYFYGDYKGVKVCVSEVVITRGSGKHKSYYNRLCVLFSVNKNFEGKTIALKDKGMLNCFNRSFKLENIKLEDPVFEKEWEIYSDCQVEARYLLTTAFMERVLNVRDIYHSKSLQFSFFDNHLLLAIDRKKDMFEATSINRPASDKAHVYETLEQILSVLSIVDILKLNQNIGL